MPTRKHARTVLTAYAVLPKIYVSSRVKTVSNTKLELPEQKKSMGSTRKSLRDDFMLVPFFKAGGAAFSPRCSSFPMPERRGAPPPRFFPGRLGGRPPSLLYISL